MAYSSHFLMYGAAWQIPLLSFLGALMVLISAYLCCFVLNVFSCFLKSITFLKLLTCMKKAPSQVFCGRALLRGAHVRKECLSIQFS